MSVDNVELIPNNKIDFPSMMIMIAGIEYSKSINVDLSKVEIEPKLEFGQVWYQDKHIKMVFSKDDTFDAKMIFTSQRGEIQE